MFLFERHQVRRKTASRLLAPALLTAAVAVCLLASACSSGLAPDVTGLTLEQAQKAADKAGLKLTESDVASFLPAGTVLAQDPAPGAASTDGTLQITVGRDPIPVKITKLRSYDPDGDNRENDAALPKLYDGDQSTSWSTETTYRTPDFQGLGDKIGVGISFWLDEAATMLKIDYTLTGWEGEVQKVSSSDLPVALAQLGQNQRVSWNEPITSGRIWFTRLTLLPDSTKYGVIINEITFYR
jgi:hypothetical protein